MEDTVDNILSRKNKLEKSIKSLENRLSREKDEYEDLSTAIEVMERYGLSTDESDVLSKGNAPSTVGDMAIEILKDFPDGLTASNILFEIQKRWKPDLVRTSLSPPLSRLKEKGEIEYLESTAHWRLPVEEEIPQYTNEASVSHWDDEEIPF
jgi:hypothetical protein